MGFLKVRIKQSEEREDGALSTATIRRLETDMASADTLDWTLILHGLAKIGTTGEIALFDSEGYRLCDSLGNELYASLVK